MLAKIKERIADTESRQKAFRLLLHVDTPLLILRILGGAKAVSGDIWVQGGKHVVGAFTTPTGDTGLMALYELLQLKEARFELMEAIIEPQGDPINVSIEELVENEDKIIQSIATRLGIIPLTVVVDESVSEAQSTAEDQTAESESDTIAEVINAQAITDVSNVSEINSKSQFRNSPPAFLPEGEYRPHDVLNFSMNFPRKPFETVSDEHDEHVEYNDLEEKDTASNVLDFKFRDSAEIEVVPVADSVSEENETVECDEPNATDVEGATDLQDAVTVCDNSASSDNITRATVEAISAFSGVGVDGFGQQTAGLGGDDPAHRIDEMKSLRSAPSARNRKIVALAIGAITVALIALGTVQFKTFKAQADLAERKNASKLLHDSLQ